MAVTGVTPISSGRGRCAGCLACRLAAGVTWAEGAAAGRGQRRGLAARGRGAPFPSLPVPAPFLSGPGPARPALAPQWERGGLGILRPFLRPGCGDLPFFPPRAGPYRWPGAAWPCLGRRARGVAVAGAGRRLRGGFCRTRRWEAVKLVPDGPSGGRRCRK